MYVTAGISADARDSGGRSATVHRGGRRAHHESSQATQAQRTSTGGELACVFSL